MKGKDMTKSVGMLLAAIAPGPLASLFGSPIEGAVLTEGVTAAVASVFANLATDHFKALAQPQNDNYLELQRCVAHAVANCLNKVLIAESAGGSEHRLEFIEDLRDAMKHAARNPIALEHAFKTSGQAIDMEPFYYFTGEVDEDVVWSGMQAIFANLELRDGRKWTHDDAGIDDLRDLLRRELLRHYKHELPVALQQTEFQAAWKGLLQKTLNDLYKVVNESPERFDTLDDSLGSLKDLLYQISQAQQELNDRSTKLEEKMNALSTIADHKEFFAESYSIQLDTLTRPPEFALTNADFTLISKEFLNKLQAPTKVECVWYYKGHPVNWNMVYHKRTALRETTTKLLEALEQPTFQVLTLTGAGGEGKTTILMQTAIAMCEKGCLVYYANGNQDVLSMDVIDHHAGQDVLIVIDNAEYYQNLPGFIRKASRSAATVKIVMAARQNEWNNSSVYKNIQKVLKDEIRYFTNFDVNGINESEASQIAALLLSSGAVDSDHDQASLKESLLTDTNGFLLAAMLTTTYGKPLENILLSVLHQLNNFEKSEELLDILAIIVVFDCLKKHFSDKVATCSVPVISKIINKEVKEVEKLLYGLSGEIQSRSRKSISTRHESIARIFHQFLFDKSNEFSRDAHHLMTLILYFAGDQSKMSLDNLEGKLLYQLPNYYKSVEGLGYPFAKELFEISTQQDNIRYKIWIEWAKLEEEHNNIGSIRVKGSARWLYFDSLRLFKNEFQVWHKWANMERRLGNIGSPSEEYTARWIAKEGAGLNPSAQPLWGLWAELEAQADHIGDNVTCEESARWIYHSFVQRESNSSNHWCQWAQLEESIGNIGTVEHPFTARWILQRGVDTVIKGSPLWLFWAELEKKQNNIGCIEEPYTARWVIHEGLRKQKNNVDLWIFAAELEYEMEGIGTIDEEYTSRWYFKNSLKYCDISAIASVWGRIETEVGNIGSITEPYSARWILWEGIKLNPRFSMIWARLLDLEIEQIAVASSRADTLPNVFRIFNKCLEASPTFLKWDVGMEIERKLRNLKAR